MDKYSRYYGIIAGLGIVCVVGLLVYSILNPKFVELTDVSSQLNSKQEILNQKTNDMETIKNKLKKLKDSNASAQKKVFAPDEENLGDDTLFFTLYNDLIEMVTANSIKVKSMKYEYNPESDSFVKLGGDAKYFVCELDMELVSNYVNLGKFIQDLYQYPYYIRILDLEVKPYINDKTILISTMKLRLYAHTSPEDEVQVDAPANVPVLPAQ